MFQVDAFGLHSSRQKDFHSPPLDSQAWEFCSFYSDLLVHFKPIWKSTSKPSVFSCMIVSEKLGNLKRQGIGFVLDCCWCTVSIRLRDLEDPELRKPRGDTASLSINLELGLEPQSSQHIFRYDIICIYIYTVHVWLMAKDHALSQPQTCFPSCCYIEPKRLWRTKSVWRKSFCWQSQSWLSSCKLDTLKHIPSGPSHLINVATCNLSEKNCDLLWVTPR